MTFSPARSIADSAGAAVVAVSNFPAVQDVDVLNFPADQLVHFTQPVDVDVLSLPTPLAVIGPLTDAELAARLPLDVDVTNDSIAVTGPLTADELADAGLATEETASDVALTAILERERMDTE